MQRTSRRIVGSVAPRLPWARAAHGRSGSFPPVPRGDSRGARARARGAAGVARDQGRGGVVHVSGARKICLLHVARASDPLPTLFPWYRVAASPSPPQHAGMRGHVHVPPIRARPRQGRGGVELDGRGVRGTRRWKGRRLTGRGSMRVDMGEGERRTVSGAEMIGLLGQLVCVCDH
jgi:hypothetical protein